MSNFRNAPFQLSLQDKFREIKLLGQKIQVLAILRNIDKLSSIEVISLKPLEIWKIYTRKIEMLPRDIYTKRVEQFFSYVAFFLKKRADKHVKQHHGSTISTVQMVGNSTRQRIPFQQIKWRNKRQWESERQGDRWLQRDKRHINKLKCLYIYLDTGCNKQTV